MTRDGDYDEPEEEGRRNGRPTRHAKGPLQPGLTNFEQVVHKCGAGPCG